MLLLILTPMQRRKTLAVSPNACHVYTSPNSRDSSNIQFDHLYTNTKYGIQSKL